MSRNDLRLFTNICAAKGNLALGFWAMAGLFCACFFLIHILRWAAAYFIENKRGAKRNAAPPPPPQPKPPEKKPKPATEKQPEKIYYIVEKKKKRESPKYSEPKEFRFK